MVSKKNRRRCYGHIPSKFNIYLDLFRFLEVVDVYAMVYLHQDGKYDYKPCVFKLIRKRV